MEINKDEILINKEISFADIQRAFSGSYPFLKIDPLPTEQHAALYKSEFIDPGTFPVPFITKDTTIKINISPNKTIADVVQDFKDLTGVRVKVSRRIGKVWLAISITEEWTLQSQNAAGEDISSEIVASND